MTRPRSRVPIRRLSETFKTKTSKHQPNKGIYQVAAEGKHADPLSLPFLLKSLMPPWGPTLLTSLITLSKLINMICGVSSQHRNSGDTLKP